MSWELRVEISLVLNLPTFGPDHVPGTRVHVTLSVHETSHFENEAVAEDAAPIGSCDSDLSGAFVCFGPEFITSSGPRPPPLQGLWVLCVWADPLKPVVWVQIM